MKVKDLQAKLNAMNPDEEIASIIWTVEDVIDLSIQLKIHLTDAQAERVLHLCVTEHDAEIGINYDSVKANIQRVVED